MQITDLARTARSLYSMTMCQITVGYSAVIYNHLDLHKFVDRQPPLVVKEEEEDDDEKKERKKHQKLAPSAPEANKLFSRVERLFTT
ncbi:hypothetical protein RB195_017885 [Necator americanus]|uniref:Uncharacterized protein n=1 Tax=Necator americanus TaxID=51031 RepID=A0ABR1C772_NECAM